MKEFDWEHSKKVHSPERHAFLLANFDKNVTEEEYVAAVSSWPRTKKRVGVAPGKQRQPSQAKRDYRVLKERFGFFGGPRDV